MIDAPLRLGRRQQWAADGLLLVVTAIWGSTFAMVKDAISLYPVFPFLSLRFALGLVALLAIGRRNLLSLNRTSVLFAALAGLFLLGGYALQTLGLQFASASRAGFITGLSVVLVPVLSSLLLRERPQTPAVAGITLAFIGLFLLTSDSAVGHGRGDLLVLLGALSFACHIVTVGIIARRADPVALTIVQLAVVALLSGIIAQAMGQWSAPPPATWGAAAFTGILATSVAFGLQTSMQRYTTATHTALIFTAEPVFAALFGALFHGDVLTPQIVAGGVLILIGAVTSEVIWSDRTALVVSRFMAPHYIIGISLTLLGLNTPESWVVGLGWVALVGLPSILLVLAVFLRALKKGIISDWHVSERKERLSPSLIIASVILSGLPALVLHLLQGPRFLLAAALGTFFLVGLNLLITAVWKISQHVSGIALGTTLLTASFGIVAAPSLLLIPLVAWARVRVRAHTVAQTVAGGLTGCAVACATLMYLGLV